VSLRLLVSHPDAQRGAQWRDALQAELPAACVEDWLPHSAPADYGLGWAVPPELFLQQPALRAFFCAGAGVDDLLASRTVPAGLAILRVQDAGMGEQMADYCTAAVLDWYGHRRSYVRQQAAGQWYEGPLERREDWPLGLFGCGALGRAVAARFTQLGFPWRSVTRSQLENGSVDLQEFLAGSRVLILLAPLTAQTRGLFNARRLGWLPRGACLINVSRGALVDEQALLAALDSGHLAAAQLDVFDTEPLAQRHPYWQHPRVGVTPHIAAFTVIEPAAAQIAARIRALEAGATAAGLDGYVDRDRGY
jgi:glyoxylate/hydroxypyruvate reductase A